MDVASMSTCGDHGVFACHITTAVIFDQLACHGACTAKLRVVSEPGEVMRMSTKVRRFIRIILSHVPHWGGPRIIPARSSSVVAPQRKLEGAIRPGKLQTDVPPTQRSGDASVLP